MSQPSDELDTAPSRRSRRARWPNKRYLDLILYKTYADLRAESERTYVGYLWWVIDPVIHMAVYYVVFGLFLDRGGPDFAPFLLVGLLPWRWFFTTVRVGSGSIIANAPLMRQVYLPKEILPTVAILNFTVRFVVAFTLLLIFLWLWGYPPSPAYLALPLVMLTQAALIFAVGWTLAAVVPFFPDLRLLIDNGLVLLFFLSGIFYSGATLPEEYQRYFYLNPIANLIESYRAILLEGAWPSWPALAAVAAAGLATLAAGFALLRRFDRFYPRVIQ